MIHIPSFKDAFLLEINRVLDEDLTFKLLSKNLLEIIYEFSNTDKKSIKPLTIIENFKKNHKKFQNKSHQDSQEFLRMFLDDLSSELNRNTTIPPYIEINNQGKTKIQLNDEYHGIFVKREDSFIIDLFHSQICNTFICTNCTFETYSFEKILDLPLLISKYSINLDQRYNFKCNFIDLLDDYFREDLLDWDNNCAFCFTRAKHKKISKISKLSKILIITFQRYNFRTNNKNNIMIAFKDSLNLSKYIDKDCIGEKDAYKYNLTGISNHSGNINFGHYFA